MYNWKKSYVAYKTEMFEGKTPMSHCDTNVASYVTMLNYKTQMPHGEEQG